MQQSIHTEHTTDQLGVNNVFFTFILLKKIYILSKYGYLWTFYSSKNPEKSIRFSTKLLNSTIVLNINININKCFLSSKSTY